MSQSEAELAGPQTFASLLSPASVETAELRRRYGGLLELVRQLLGVLPNSAPLLEIWPTAFRTYNLMVPNFLNLPLLLFGWGAPKEIVGLAMYVSSRTAGCAYCSAHSCSFALRRGTASGKLATAYGSTLDGSVHSAAEQAVMAVAEGLSQVPVTFGAADRARLERYFSPSQAEWLALAVAMMGFLNKLMDAMGVPLEDQIVGEAEAVIGASGWAPGKHGTGAALPGTLPRADTISTTLGVLRYAPRAAMLDRRWTAGVPASWPGVGTYLREQTGYEFPVLGRLHHARPRRALAAMLRDNLEPRDTQIGLQVKTLAGLVYATVVKDEKLAAEARHLAGITGVPDAVLGAVADFASTPALFDTEQDLTEGEIALRSLNGLGQRWPEMLVLAKASSFSPAQVSRPLVTRAAQLPPAALIELITWISLQQLLHRLAAYFA